MLNELRELKNSEHSVLSIPSQKRLLEDFYPVPIEKVAGVEYRWIQDSETWKQIRFLVAAIGDMPDR